MKKMLLIVPALHQGGFEKVCVATARLLQPYFQIQIVIFDSREIAYDIRGLEVIDLHLPSRPGKLVKLWNVVKRGYKLHQIKKKEGIDIAYSFGPTANIANIVSGAEAAKWLGIRSYMDMNNPKQIEWFCKSADKVLCCSERIRGEIEKDYGCQKAVTLHNPFDLKEIELLAEKEEASLPWEEGRILVSMGREDTVKGFWHLIKSFSLVHEALPDTKLMIIGQGEYAQYKELAAGLGIEEAVCFTGLQKNPYPYLKRSSLYVLTSYNEGFPNALVEAMALGVPAVATDCLTGPDEILEDRYGILVPNMSPEADFSPRNITEEERELADRIIALLEDEGQMEHYREMAKKRAGDYTAERYIAGIRAMAQ
ncbi:MAG: glycosyltransferase [Blautia sp.]|nr:glycosyltransferase [Blautia sp.]MCM1200899.1 glycosyltransferase [Bacteroides fragilis]